MGSKTSDQLLVARAKQGDRKAFDALVVKYHSRMMNLSARFARNYSDACDITQDAFINAYRALPGFREESSFYTWLYRITVNTAKNYTGAKARRVSESAIDITEMEQIEQNDTLKEQATPERLLMAAELHETVVAALEGLPDNLRAAFSLRELEGMSYEEIATVMSCPVGTVRSRIFRAREAVYDSLKPLLGE